MRVEVSVRAVDSPERAKLLRFVCAFVFREVNVAVARHLKCPLKQFIMKYKKTQRYSVKIV